MSEPLRVLLVEDSENDARLVLRELQRGGFTVQSGCVQTAEAMRQVLTSSTWDVVLADYRLPTFDGLAALHLLRELDPDLPFILVSGAIGEDAAVDAMKAGAQDFVMKERLTRLVPAVRRELREAENRRRQRALELSVREGRQRLQSILDHSPALIYVSDLEGRLLLTNRLFDQTFARGSDTLLGKTVSQVFPADVAAIRRRHDQTAIAQEGPVALEESFGDKDDSRTYLAVSFPLRDTSGEIYGTCMIATDITERKLLETQLLHAQKMEAVGQLAGGVAHDFNNILAAMTMTIDLLRSADAGISVPQGLAELEQSAKRAAALTRQLLLFSRGQMLQPQPIELNALLSGLMAMLRRLMPESIGIEFVAAAEPVWVKGDLGTIEQVITNLCVNARDAMPGGGSLVITVRRFERQQYRRSIDDSAEPFACISVRDTGCGMDAATLKRIFEPFFTTKPLGKGSGLGLATVYGIVNQHRGWVDVDSGVGRGSEFRVFLPATNPPERDAATPAAPALQGGSESVLLVEDDETLRMISGLALRRFGYRVTEVENAVQALALCREEGANFDLLLTDMVMPGGVSGAMLAQQVRRLNPRMKIIIATGYSPDIGGDTVASDFMPVYLLKPYPIEQLLAVIRRTLDTAPCAGRSSDAE